MTSRTRTFALLGALTLLAVSGCSSSTPNPGGPAQPTTSPPASSSPGVTAPTGSSAPGTEGSTDASTGATASSSDAGSSAPTTGTQPSAREQAEALADKLSVKEQAASLVMAGIPATGGESAELSALSEQGISSIFLRGRSKLSVAQTAAKVNAATSAVEGNVPADLPVWVATDQEGGFVRVLQGQGFTELPTAQTQGGWSTSKLSKQISTVGEELAEAGININLAPVADVVPASMGTGNAPIGYYGRQYGDQADEVAQAVLTVNEALAASGVTPVVKHFPGLGRVAENTDTSTSVTDTEIDAKSADLEPFRRAIEQGTAWVMISNARYTRIDAKNDAPFSAKLITGLLREDLGYSGVVISDDLCEAAQVSEVSVGQRAVKFVAAGGTVPLCVNSSGALTMAKALAARAAEDQDFAEQVREAAVLVLQSKLEQRDG